MSDEPGKEHLEAYTAAAALLKQYLPGYPVMDAMSDYEVYHQSGVSDPVVALNHIEPFLEKNVSPLWGYYCCAQYEAVPNRFLAMPSYRNRVAGLLCYKFGLKGFLQWGYNFYNTQYSLEGVDPYACTDAGRGFPSAIRSRSIRRGRAAPNPCGCRCSGTPCRITAPSACLRS